MNDLQLRDESRRDRGLVRNSDGAWLCECGAKLEGDIDSMCAACRFRTDETNERRAREEWIARTRGFVAFEGVPAWPWARLDNPEFLRGRPRELVAYARSYHPSQGSVMIPGKTGSAKTALTVAMLHQHRKTEIAKVLAGPLDTGPTPLMRLLRGLVWTDGFALAKARRGTPLGRGEAELVDRAMACGLLVLDEIGFEAANDTVITEVINARYVAELPVIITTGLTRKEFAERYGDAVLRRIIERGNLLEAWT